MASARSSTQIEHGIPVYLLLEKMAAGESHGAEDLRACLEYAAILAADEVVLAEA